MWRVMAVCINTGLYSIQDSLRFAIFKLSVAYQLEAALSIAPLGYLTQVIAEVDLMFWQQNKMNHVTLRRISVCTLY